ncbi:uncharacterized protein (TIGR02231 family) [Methylohalomonas lacus]|uniref:Uncharacterized protein (TIGR02231 family) n=1 Tax=Methylohalomonas lacus TaxID=398773 RepID=A0AAE3HN86_9GAMM|nr:mucoidy inhibitor MuiA family protein [Methylohalomonas lacus]MCS3904259.1 uncharacterized protein (TIGR02231 family) [Methylohalomonas lacus]
MHYLYRTLLFGVVCLVAPALAADVDSRIDAVTLYPGNVAEIERVASVDLQDGRGDLVFSHLPASLIDGSVRVAVTDGNVRIGGVETTREPVGESPRERERELQNRIEELQRQQQDAFDRAAAAGNEITFIEGLAGLPQGEKAAEALMNDGGAENWASLWERIGNGSRAARERQRVAERAAADLNKQIETLQQKLNQLGRSRPEMVRVSVPYRANGAGRAELTLSYRVRGPSWQPRYETRLDTSAGKVTLNRSARVSQATGEDWNDVTLALSTSQPVHGEQPQLDPWWIDFAPEVEPMPRADKAVMMESMDGVGAAQQAEAPAQTVNAEFAATYLIDGRVTIAAGNEPRELPIGSHDLTAVIGAETLPQIDPRAWLVAETTWDGAGPLPPGRIARFRDGAYIGEGRLDGWAPGEERTLAFGIDPSIEVSFKPTKDETGKSGWVTSKSTLVRDYTLEVINHHDRSLPVTALIRMPVAKNEDIEVEPNYSVEPDEKDVDGDKGVMAWHLDLDDNDSRRLRFGYRISYPEGRELRGM